MDRDCARRAAKRRRGGVEVEVKEFGTSRRPVRPRTCRRGAQRGRGAGLPHQDIVSGAGHDAVYIARVAPAAMIFVPCEDGISHNEIENATPEDLAAGCDVLLNAMLDRANACL